MADAPPKPNELIAQRRRQRGLTMRDTIKRTGIKMGHGTFMRLEKQADWGFATIDYIKGLARALGLSSRELALLALGETPEEPSFPREAQALMTLLLKGGAEEARRLLREMPQEQVAELELAAARLVSLCLERQQVK